MYKLISSLIIILLTCCRGAFAANSQSAKNRYLDKTKISLAAANDKKHIFISPIIGLRYDVLQWSISGNGGSKLSELTWKNKIAEIGLEILTEQKDNQLNFLGSVKYGKISDGSENQDSDWDHLGEFSKTFSKVKGNTFDISGAIGLSENRVSKFPFAFTTYHFAFDYNYSKLEDFGLNYKIHRLQHATSLRPTGQLNPNTHLVNTYKYQNYAPWFGTKLHYKLNDRLSFSPFLKAYLFAYNAEADWILRSDFQHNPSFRHKAIGTGLSLDAELLYKVANYLDIHANIGIKKLTMLKGTDKIYLSNGLVASYPLKGLTILTNTINIGVRYKF